MATRHKPGNGFSKARAQTATHSLFGATVEIALIDPRMTRNKFSEIGCRIQVLISLTEQIEMKNNSV